MAMRCTFCGHVSHSVEDHWMHYQESHPFADESPADLGLTASQTPFSETFSDDAPASGEATVGVSFPDDHEDPDDDFEDL